jgi:hypothetical protein
VISLKFDNFDIIVSSVYCPPRHRVTSEQFKTFFKSLGSRFITGGDFNSKHVQWGSRNINPKGRALHNTIRDCNLKFISPPFYTYWPTSPRRRPDLLDFFVTKSCNFFHSIEPLDMLCFRSFFSLACSFCYSSHNFSKTNVDTRSNELGSIPK